MEKLFTQAPGLTSPWVVTSEDFAAVQGRINFVANSEARRLTRPHCGATEQPVHDHTSARGNT